LPRWDGYCYIGAMAHALGYARVSTGDQDARLQHDALQAAGSYRIFTDTASGSLQSRPELDKLMDQLRPGDTVVVCAWSCWGARFCTLYISCPICRLVVSSSDRCKKISIRLLLVVDWCSIFSPPWRSLNAT